MGDWLSRNKGTNGVCAGVRATSEDEPSNYSREEDWEVFGDEELETMFQGLPVSIDEYIDNESDASMDKNVNTPQGSEHDDDGTDGAERPLLNVDSVAGDYTTNVPPPTVLLCDGPSAGVQHSITTECRQLAHFHELLAHDRSLGVDCEADKYVWSSEERRLNREI
ncbi:hypothetical protein KIN20_009541 [Parelaphostrongylus tenuis]|uniref:Uncharacterized protein n=1 Tax=Parelaphostrongylus tenuis TaxID=148309 RepID=A0AAD5MP64_PARTN|nr:hypothetical protein KIN20_009541 [Parelaphostrongylus tenuis]